MHSSTGCKCLISSSHPVSEHSWSDFPDEETLVGDEKYPPQRSTVNKWRSKFQTEICLISITACDPSTLCKAVEVIGHISNTDAHCQWPLYLFWPDSGSGAAVPESHHHSTSTLIAGHLSPVSLSVSASWLCLGFLARHVAITGMGMMTLLWVLNDYHIKALRTESVTWWAGHKYLLLQLFFIIQNVTCGSSRIADLPSATVTSKILAELEYSVSN